jgi:hypothetical protein
MLLAVLGAVSLIVHARGGTGSGQVYAGLTLAQAQSTPDAQLVDMVASDMVCRLLVGNDIGDIPPAGWRKLPEAQRICFVIGFVQLPLVDRASQGFIDCFVRYGDAGPDAGLADLAEVHDRLGCPLSAGVLAEADAFARSPAGRDAIRAARRAAPAGGPPGQRQAEPSPFAPFDRRFAEAFAKERPDRKAATWIRERLPEIFDDSPPH